MMTPTLLYNIEPIGIGTPYVESLPSYIKRLADAHCVLPGVLLKNEIFLESQEFYYYIAFFNYERKSMQISVDFIDEAIEILETKTGNQNIRNTTITKYGPRVYSELMYRKYAAWCPKCYEERKLSGQPVYEPLIWCFKDIKICRKHNVNLVDVCPYCGKQVKRITYRARAGYCSYCQSWLGMNDFNDMWLVEKQDMLVYNRISDMLSQTPEIIKPTVLGHKVGIKKNRAIRTPNSIVSEQAGHSGRRRIITLEQVEEAINLLTQNNESITYKKVAEKAGISVRAINNRNDLQELIKRYKYLRNIRQE